MIRRRPLLTLGAATVALPAGLLAGRAVHAAALVGQPAPDFSLTDTTGKTVRLSQFKGKPVVLEWNNPGCPFVRKHYQGNMQALQKAAREQGLAWLTINSTEEASADYLSPAELAEFYPSRLASRLLATWPPQVIEGEDLRLKKLLAVQDFKRAASGDV